MKNVCIFEDKGFSRFLPITYTRATFELRCGIDLLMDKVARQYPKSRISLFCRDYLAGVMKARYPINSINKCEDSEDGCLFINGRLLLNAPVPLDGPEEAGVDAGGALLYVRADKESCAKITSKLLLENDPLKKIKIKAVQSEELAVINYIWEIIERNQKQLTADFNALTGGKGSVKGKVYDGANLLNISKIYIGKGAAVKPGCVLDAEEGPIYIDDDALVQPCAVIEGPGFIGKKSIIRIGAKIRAGASIGESSRIGGEVEDSIIQSYSNKQHDGFLGHGYIGSWCNLGAGTNNSDLKNNYGNVKVFVEGKLMDSGSMFVGLTMGDHSKSGIGTAFNTGTVIGIMCNIFGEGMPPKFVPSFSWGGAKGFIEYKPEKALETAEKVMSRRKVKLSSEERKLYTELYKLSGIEKTYKLINK